MLTVIQDQEYTFVAKIGYKSIFYALCLTRLLEKTHLAGNRLGHYVSSLMRSESRQIVDVFIREFDKVHAVRKTIRIVLRNLVSQNLGYLCLTNAPFPYESE